MFKLKQKKCKEICKIINLIQFFKSKFEHASLFPDPHSEKLLDPDPQKMNADPQACNIQPVVEKKRGPREAVYFDVFPYFFNLFFLSHFSCSWGDTRLQLFSSLVRFYFYK